MAKKKAKVTAPDEPTTPGSAPTETAPPEGEPTKAKVAKAGKQSKDSCVGCQHYYDSGVDPTYQSGRDHQQLCTKHSPSVETGGKKLDPCPAEGEGIGMHYLTPEEAKMVHEYRLKKGKAGDKTKRN